MYTFWLTPTWASAQPNVPCIIGGYTNDPGCAGEPANMMVWNAFVSNVAIRYNGVINYYELWNEPNCPCEYNGSIQYMVQMAAAANTIIHKINPKAILIAPGVERGNTGTGGAFGGWTKDFLTDGGSQYVQALAWHGYICNESEGFSACANIGCYGGSTAIDCAGTPLIYQIVQLESIAKEYNVVPNLWNTEGGWLTNSELSNTTMQAAFLSRWYIIQASYNVTSAIWWEWGAPPISASTAYGSLHYLNNTLTPAGKAYYQVGKWLIGSSIQACKTTNSSAELFTCPIKLLNGTLDMLAFAGNTPIAYQVNTIKFNRYQNLNGSVNAINGNFIPIGIEPILLENATKGAGNA